MKNEFGLISVDELAGLLGKAPQTIRNWVAARRIPHVRVGRTTMFRQESIESWLTTNEVK